MNGEAAEQVVRMSLEGFEVAAKVTGEGAKDIAVLLYTVMKNKEQTSGKAKLTNMLKTGKPLSVFSVRNDDLPKFQQEAKRYGILYCALVDKKNKDKDGVVDIVIRQEDSGRVNRIVDRFKLSSFNKAEIISDIEKSRDEKVPHLEKTDQKNLSKNSLKDKSSSMGNSKVDKPSVKAKLKEYKKIAEEQSKQRNVNKTKSKTATKKVHKEQVK